MEILRWKQFISWEEHSKDTIDVKKSYIDMADDLMAGILLSQIIYWYLPDSNGNTKLRVKKEGHFWIAKEIKEWYEEIRFTKKHYMTAIKKLIEKEIIIKKIFKFKNKTTTHIRLNIPVFLQELNKILNNYEEKLSPEIDEFNTYLEKEMDIKPMSDVGSTKSELLEMPNRNFEKYQIGTSRNAESGPPITKSTTESTAKNITKIKKEDEEDNNAHAREESAIHFLYQKLESKSLTQNEKEFFKQCKRYKYMDEHVALLFNLVKDIINEVDFEAIRRSITIFEINMMKKNIKKPFNSDWLKTTLQNESMYLQYDKNKEYAVNSF
ncbi:hypothetical protein [Chengkuizengella sediminis]|uniref:hypothetical protein n=1 Tax=Chengkuizengella sediminis TaxID=1885917 RepID=UPI00138A3D7D|nr:hypothetical protein [Chengkuizengella sediminis]NDI36609.1 hypothetical protein [Chengkuizengella sediminis]